MRLRWTEQAADDLERIADYLLLHAPVRAADLVRAVYEAPATLLRFAAVQGRRRALESSFSRLSPTSSCTPFEAM
jgi:plasmid stabilization system protein ParE